MSNVAVRSVLFVCVLQAVLVGWAAAAGAPIESVELAVEPADAMEAVDEPTLPSWLEVGSRPVEPIYGPIVLARATTWRFGSGITQDLEAAGPSLAACVSTYGNVELTWLGGQPTAAGLGWHVDARFDPACMDGALAAIATPAVPEDTTATLWFHEAVELEGTIVALTGLEHIDDPPCGIAASYRTVGIHVDAVLTGGAPSALEARQLACGQSYAEMAAELIGRRFRMRIARGAYQWDWELEAHTPLEE
jgi:hypothetical protein